MKDTAMLKFLKKYSGVSHTFVDDFFGLYDRKDKYNFCISTAVIAKWYGITTQKIKEVLQKSYKEYIDYTIVSRKVMGKTGRPTETIMITPRCFKLMAMQGRTKKAQEVREYYLEVEDTLERYKDYIIEGLNEKIHQLENNQKPKINPKRGVIYILQTAEGVGYYKVGRTKNLKQRLKSYNADKANDIVPLFLYETKDVAKIEACIKTFAKEFQYRRCKEVYQADLEMLKRLIVQCAEFADNVFLKRREKSTIQGGNYHIAVFSE